MTQKFKLSCESTIDLPFEYVDNREIAVLFYILLVNDNEIEDNMDRNKDFNTEFYNYLKGSDEISTSQINQYYYEQYFEKMAKEGIENILHITFGTGMTRSYPNAVKAANVINAKYSNTKIIVIDSTCSCGGYGMLVDYIADLRDSGSDIEDAVKWVEENKTNIQHHFYNADLSYFIKSGRLTGPAATIANVLNIVPIMKLDFGGNMIAYSKVRGAKKAISKTLDQMIEHAKDGINYSGKCFINHCYNIEEAEILANKIKEKFKNISEIRIQNIGNVIAAHCGPGTVSLFFIGDTRTQS